jgi:hypothetical protein
VHTSAVYKTADKKAKHELAVYKERKRIEQEREGEKKLAAILVDARRATVADRVESKRKTRRKK